MFDFKHAGKRCITQVKLEPIEAHQERILKIKKKQYGEKFNKYEKEF